MFAWRARIEPPLESVLEGRGRVYIRHQRFRHPLLRDDPPAVPTAVVQKEIPDLRQTGAVEIQAALGVHHTEIGALPMVFDAERREKMRLAVRVDVLAGLLLEDVGEQFRGAAAVVEYRSRAGN